MFRIEFFVDDKKLSAALLALTHIARGAPTVTPVVNAISNGKNGIAAAGSGLAIDRFIEALKKHKGREIDAAGAREIAGSVGLNSESISYYLTKAREAGALKKKPGSIGSGTIYKVQ